VSPRKPKQVSEAVPDDAVPDEAVPDNILADGSGPVEAATADDLAHAVEALGDHEPAGDLEPSAEPDSDVAVEVTVTSEDESAEPVAAVLPTSAAVLDDDKLKHLVEAIIFAADKPVTMQRLRQLTRISDAHRLDQTLEQLALDFADRGIALQQVSGGYQFRTNTTYSAWVQQLVAGRPVRLSRAQLETLAIVAYRQPITRPEIDEIRGVDSSATLRLLLDRSLVRVLGKREEVGRPILYGTTSEFLDFFSLQDLRELPTLREYSELTAESRQVMSDRLGVSVDGLSEPEVDLEPAAEPAAEPDRDHAAPASAATESEPAE
jgi:segregation and condensation protein B